MIGYQVGRIEIYKMDVSNQGLVQEEESEE
jgi:hypothetical protein